MIKDALSLEGWAAIMALILLLSLGELGCAHQTTEEETDELFQS